MEKEKKHGQKNTPIIYTKNPQKFVKDRKSKPNHNYESLTDRPQTEWPIVIEIN